MNPAKAGQLRSCQPIASGHGLSRAKFLDLRTKSQVMDWLLAYLLRGTSSYTVHLPIVETIRADDCLALVGSLETVTCSGRIPSQWHRHKGEGRVQGGTRELGCKHSGFEEPSAAGV